MGDWPRKRLRALRRLPSLDVDSHGINSVWAGGVSSDSALARGGSWRPADNVAGAPSASKAASVGRRNCREISWLARPKLRDAFLRRSQLDGRAHAIYTI